MTQNSWKKLEPVTFLASFGMLIALWGESAFAQSNIVPDDTLGEESSQVRTDEVKGNPAEVIEGGAQRGANLFHSFSEFNVENGRGAYFANPTAIENIFSRVTGSNPSKIFGTLGVSGNADLFLINPNGIIFGENARLDVGGSFIGSTADSVVFNNNFEFSASNPQVPPLLKIDVAMGLQYGNNPGSIQVQGNGQGTRKTTELIDTNEALRVKSDETLALVGGEVSLEGATIKTAGGRIELGSVDNPNLVKLTPIDKGWALDYASVQSFGDIQLSQQAAVDASGLGAGDVRVQGKQVRLTNGSQIQTSVLGSQSGGSLIVKASESIELFGKSPNIEFQNRIVAEVYPSATGNGGNIQIETDQLRLTDGAQISASTLGEGNAGNLTVNAQSIDLIGQVDSERNFFSGLYSVVQPSAKGDGGDIRIDTNQLRVADGAQISAYTVDEGNAGNISIQAQSIELTGETANGQFGSGISAQVGLLSATGDGGNIQIDTEQLRLTDKAAIITSTFGEGNAGNINIQAQSIELVGKFAIKQGIGSQSGIGSQVGFPSATGDAGNIQIDTNQLRIIDGGVISTSTFGEGNAGNINIQAQSIELVGKFAIEQGIVSQGGIASQVGFPPATGDGGNIQIDTNQLRIIDGAKIATNTFGEGNAGNITVNAQFIELIGETVVDEFEFGSGLLTSVQPSANGDGGNLQINTDRLLVSDGAELLANTQGQGNAGDLTVTASQLTLQNQGELSVSGQGNVDPGNLTVTADNIILDNQSLIEANTESGSQGNITLNTENLLTLRRESEISTNSTGTATGGNITINADDGFIVAVPEENSDITANATQAEGGRVFVDATNLYGIEPSEQLTPQSDITASSELGSEFSGIVEINTPNVDPNRDLVQLPNQPTETEIVQACAPSETDEQSEFIITGRGGLPPSPEIPLESDALAVDWVTRQPQNQNSHPKVSTDSITSEPAPIIEAQGWIVNENNEIVLVAHNSNNSWQNLPQCYERSGVRGQGSEGQNRSLLSNDSEQNILIASTEPQSLSAKVPERININYFKVKGNTVFESEELTEVLAPFTNKPLSFSQLLQARTTITDYYTKRGYLTSGAYIPLQRLQDKVVTIEIVEGYLEDIKITGNKRLNSDYVSSRIETATEDSLQREELLAALQLLQQDPLIASISAELAAGTRPGASVLEVEVREANSFNTPILLDNRRAPSVGSFRRQFAINEGNLLGFGDNLFLAYSNTEGSDAFDGSYAFPINASNGTVTVRGGVSSSEVVEEPFNQLNILGDSHYYELSLRQPFVQTPTQEFAIGITASRRNSDISSLLDEFNVPPSELSPGADETGQTQVSALRFFQEWTSRSDRQVIAARSEFNLGLGIFDATVNDDAPDSRFFAWQGQAQWTRQLARDTLFLLRGGIQLATTSLLPSEQFGLGRLETLRGYRQDLLLTDNAAFATAEFRLPIFRIRSINSVLQLAPFFDLGAAWNNGEERDVPDPNTLASIGLGLRLSLFDSFIARFDWGIPLISVDTESNTWQENGLYFSVEYSPF